MTEFSARCLPKLLAGTVFVSGVPGLLSSLRGWGRTQFLVVVGLRFPFPRWLLAATDHTHFLSWGPFYFQSQQGRISCASDSPLVLGISDLYTFDLQDCNQEVRPSWEISLS